jgi:hypothetical protein
MSSLPERTTSVPSLAPAFYGPTPTRTPQIENLFHSTSYLEDGLKWSGFTQKFPDESSEALQGGRTLHFVHVDTTGFVNCKRIFLDLTYEVLDDLAGANKNKPILPAHKYVTTSNPPSHALIDQVTCNIG